MSSERSGDPPPPGATVNAITAFILKASRPGFWITSVWFYLLPLARRDVFSTADFWIGLAYVTLPLGLLIYGWNDCVDAETDRLNPRKDNYLFGARGTREQLAQLPYWIVAAQVPFAILFAVKIGLWQTLAFFGALTFTTWLYNVPRGGAKCRPGWDLMNQVGYLLVFVLSSWINSVPQLPWFTMVFGAMFAMHSHLFGEIMDLEPDIAAGRRTTAIVLGRVRTKWFLTGMLTIEAVLLLAATHDFRISALLLAGSLWFVADACWLWKGNPYTPWQERFFFLGWNAAAIVTAPLVWKMGVLAAN